METLLNQDKLQMGLDFILTENRLPSATLLQQSKSTSTHGRKNNTSKKPKMIASPQTNTYHTPKSLTYTYATGKIYYCLHSSNLPKG